MAVSWSYFNKFEDIVDKYMPRMGQGETMASQIVTAVNKLVYKWYNDGDVYDNTYTLKGWCNDLSSYANWLSQYCKSARSILRDIEDCSSEGDYEDLLQRLADTVLKEEYLSFYANKKSMGDIYNCKGEFVFLDYEEDPFDEDEYEDPYYDDDEDEDYE